MKYRSLGRTGIEVSTLCLGTAFRGMPGEAACRATIERALDGGINFIDCANKYQDGLSEEIVGRTLKGKRDGMVLATKVCDRVGDGPNDRGLSRLHILREVENSLRRLQTDHVDLYYAHHADPRTPIDESLRAFDDLVRQGKVRYIGCSNFTTGQLREALCVSEREHSSAFVCTQDPYSLLDRRVEPERIPLCVATGLGLTTYSSLGIGLLTGRFHRDRTPPPDTHWGRRPEQFARVMNDDVERTLATVRRIAGERGKTPAQVALAWLMNRTAVAAAIVGPETPEQVDENLGALGWELSAQETSALDDVSAWARRG